MGEAAYLRRSRSYDPNSVPSISTGSSSKICPWGERGERGERDETGGVCQSKGSVRIACACSHAVGIDPGISWISSTSSRWGSGKEPGILKRTRRMMG